MFLVQLPDQSRRSPEVKQAAQDFIHLALGNPPETQTGPPCLGVFRLKKLFLYMPSEPLVSTCACCPLSSCCAPLWRAWLCHPDALPIGTGGLLLGTSKAFPEPSLPKLSTQGKCSSLTALAAPTELSNLSISLFHWGTKTRCSCFITC